MKIQIDIDEKNVGISVTIHAKEWSDELDLIVKSLNNPKPERLLGSIEDQSIVLNPIEIDFVFAENRKVYASWNKQQIELKLKLYEVEKMLESIHFTRFSKSVIGNFQNIERFELSFNGNLCVYFKSGSKEYVSRNYVSNLKQKLLMGGHTNDI